MKVFSFFFFYVAHHIYFFSCAGFGFVIIRQHESIACSYVTAIAWTATIVLANALQLKHLVSILLKERNRGLIVDKDFSVGGRHDEQCIRLEVGDKGC